MIRSTLLWLGHKSIQLRKDTVISSWKISQHIIFHKIYIRIIIFVCVNSCWVRWCFIAQWKHTWLLHQYCINTWKCPSSRKQTEWCQQVRDDCMLFAAFRIQGWTVLNLGTSVFAFTQTSPEGRKEQRKEKETTDTVFTHRTNVWIIESIRSRRY